ncbi:hypothetical protein ANCCEY_14474 [Ancylostoma ceylanicum]|uniref:GDP-fucose pyrophosphorylase domain-containing protein n=1 Tax=Ancylostoma ceylanicum TaxID=53326 RepID=A0A0D6LFK1_9BILA|nr:hypothetical protein ANCCEY_14474 [Ancylostoma ceylanicum]
MRTTPANTLANEFSFSRALEVYHWGLHAHPAEHGTHAPVNVLLVHSGGLSQRMPHLSALGKIFATLPDGSTILEKKLSTYKHLSTIISPGLLVCASDVIEDISAFKHCEATSEMIAFATESSLEVAVDHGVFVLDPEGNLKSVLQKPSLEFIEEADGVLPTGNVLTDCFYWMSWSICKQLTALWQERGPCTVETCCYGDFMRPLGYAPLLDYLEQGALSSRLDVLAKIPSVVLRSCTLLAEQLHGQNKYGTEKCGYIST